MSVQSLCGVGSASFTVRDARRADVPALALLWQEMMDFHAEFDERFRFLPNASRSVEQYLSASLRSRGARVVVAESGRQLVGYSLGEIHQRRPIYPVGTYGFICDISVTAEWRRHGVGRALAESLLRWFRACGVTAVELFAAERNPVSVAFWRSLGFDDYLLLLRAELDTRPHP